jgi:hypothetical protein
MTTTNARLTDSEHRPSDESTDERPALMAILGELQGVTWYHQRADGSQDRDVAAYLSRAHVPKAA